jgi:hypothetical protein
MSEAMAWNPETPIISLWMPWANWVMLGWKEVETRLHKRFYGLAGREIGIHATAKWDETAIDAARPYLTAWQLSQTMGFPRIGGAILGTAFCVHVRPCVSGDSRIALIDCATVQRHGLSLQRPNIIEAIPARGKQGIWYLREG